MNKKFKLTKETYTLYGKKLYRIQALIDIDGSVKKGDLGGFVEKEENLAFYGDSWIYDNAKVYGNATVSGNAKVYDKAKVYGDAKVYGNAKLYDNVNVSGNAKVYGGARLYDNAEVYGNAMLYGTVKVYDSAHLYGYAKAFDNVRLYDSAKVFDNAKVCGNAKVYGNAEVSGIAKVSPINIVGLMYNITITDNHMRIGCEFHTHQKWQEFTKKQITEMDGKRARDWWEKYKNHLILLCTEHRERVKK